MPWIPNSILIRQNEAVPTGSGSPTLLFVTNRKTEGKDVCVADGDTCPGHIDKDKYKNKVLLLFNLINSGSVFASR
jgi:hypothetical protein